jgi:peptidoglycan/LPS O-acetylase OafA/YrhL
VIPNPVHAHRKLEGNAKAPDLFCSRIVIGYYQFGNMDTPVAPGRAREDPGDSRRGWERSSGSVEQLTSLTPLRGVAALWVVIFHFCWHIPTIHPERYTGAVYKGYLAVDVFFVLSGFVITHVYKDGFARRVTAWRYRNFLKARVARLYPLHVSVLLLFVATAIAERAATYALNGSFDPIPLVGERSLSGFFANLVMIQGLWARQLSWNDPAWSISLEFFAYLVFPLLFPVLWRAGRVGKAGIGCLLLAVLVWLDYCTGDYFNQWNGPYAILRCLTEFLVGSLLYSVYQSGRFAPVLASDGALLAVALLLGALLHVAAPDLGIITLFPLLILTAVRNTGYCARLLNSRPLLWLGEISYSLYLLHWFVLFLVTEVVRRLPGIDFATLPHGASLSLIVAMIGLSLALAALSFRFIEVTGRRWLRRRLDVRPVTAA